MSISSITRTFALRLNELSSQIGDTAHLLSAGIIKNDEGYYPFVMAVFPFSADDAGLPLMVQIRGNSIPAFAAEDRKFAEKLKVVMMKLAPSINLLKIQKICQLLEINNENNR